MKFYQTVLLAVAAFVLPALLLGGVWWWIQVVRLVIIGAFF